jgi:hypothetical protein
MFRMAAVGAVVTMIAFGLDAVTADGATAPAGFNLGPVLAHPHFVAAVGEYEIHANGVDLGQMDLNGDFTVTFPDLGDSGEWVTTGNSLSMSITSSSFSDVGCTFNGTVTTKGINAKGKKQGNYVCPAQPGLQKWYAVRLRV